MPTARETDKAVVFVCSTPTHIHTFAPVIAKLREDPVRCSLVSLEEYYGGDLGAVAAQHDMAVVIVHRRYGPLPMNAFYSRPIPAIWRDVLAARRDVTATLEALGPAAVVVGNDYGLMEKLVLRVAGRRGARRILVQDGRLASRRPREAGLRGRLLRLAKSALSPPFVLIGLPELAASEYGEGDVDVICAASPDSETILTGRARRGTRVVLTGQPRYGAIPAGHAPTPPDRRRTVPIFTTPFAADRISVRSQVQQVRLAAELSQRLGALDADVVVKPHPRESADAYEEAGVTTVDEMPAPLLARSWVAIIGISTVIEEAALAGVPVIVPGRVLHGDRFDHRLPPAGAFPRFETSEEAYELLDDLRDPSRWRTMAEEQQSALLGDLTATRHDRAAAAVAAEILRGL